MIALIVKSVSIGLVVYVGTQSLFYQGVYKGYNVAAVGLAGVCYPTIDGLCIFHGDPYDMLASYYTLVTWLCMGYVMVKLADRVAIFRLAAFLTAGAIVLLLFIMWDLKLAVADDPVKYIDLIRETLDREKLWLGLIGSVVALEVTRLLKEFVARFKKKTEASIP